MKRITFLLILFTLLFATYNFARADFYYNGTPQYNPYNGYTNMVFTKKVLQFNNKIMQ